MINPYIAEAGISVSLEPSLMYNFCNDNKTFIIESSNSNEEPPGCPMDDYCLDRLQRKK